jgi:coatomer subunit beta
MANAVEKSCTMLVYNDKQVSINEIKEALEGSDVEAKVEAMQKAVTMLLNGEQLPQLFITIVRYVLPSEDHAVQKLLLLYLVGASCSLSCCKQQACNPRLASCPPQAVQDL